MRQDKTQRTDIWMIIVIMILLTVGMALIVTDMKFLTIVQSTVMTVGKVYQLVFIFIRSLTRQAIHSIELSDVVGSALILWAFWMSLSRLRRQLLLRAPESRHCPACHQKLNRIHRSRPQRVLSKLFYLRSRHYLCSSCGQSSWQFSPREMHIRQS